MLEAVFFEPEECLNWHMFRNGQSKTPSGRLHSVSKSAMKGEYKKMLEWLNDPSENYVIKLKLERIPIPGSKRSFAMFLPEMAFIDEKVGTCRSVMEIGARDQHFFIEVPLHCVSMNKTLQACDNGQFRQVEKLIRGTILNM